MNFAGSRYDVAFGCMRSIITKKRRNSL